MKSFSQAMAAVKSFIKNLHGQTKSNDEIKEAAERLIADGETLGGSGSPYHKGSPYNCAFDQIAVGDWVLAHLASDAKANCDHNEMVPNSEPGYAWKCAKCGHVYGK